jgi:ketose-bisphosphate aldolase
MSLESATKLIADARNGGYAIGYFESWNLESLQGVIDAAEAMRAPVIIGFNGGFLCRPGRRTVERLVWYAEMGKAAARSANVPCALILNECPNDSWIEQAAVAGFNLLMPSDSAASYKEYLRRVKTITELAHRYGACVEAEIGELPDGRLGWVESGGSLTNPELAAKFAEASGIDLLAVSVGNVHVMVRGKQALDLVRLEEIHKRVPLPLVLHGGSGITKDSLRRATALGVAKVNYGTYLKQYYLQAVRLALKNDTINPHDLLGLGGEADVMVAGRLAVRDAVLERMKFLGCEGKADP